MNRQELLNQIEHYTPFNEQEETDKQLILNWIRTVSYTHLTLPTT